MHFKKSEHRAKGDIVEDLEVAQHDRMRNIVVDRERVITKLVSGVPLLPAQLPPIDESWTWIRKENDDLHRATREDAGRLLRVAFEKGGYAFRCGGRIKKVSFSRIKTMVEKTHVITAGHLPQLPDGQHNSLDFDHASSPIDHAIQLTLNGYKVATVNAASAYHAGGGFTSGGRHALEEAFCSQTTLYPSLEKIAKAGDHAEDSHGPYGHPHIPEDGVILSPHVEFFRRGTDQGYLLYAKPVEVTAVISMAMYNCNRRVRDSPVDRPHNDEEYEAGVRQKFVALCHAAAYAGADALVLPDVGCGVFQNEATVVGRIAGEVVHQYGAHFRLVAFTGKMEFFHAAATALTGRQSSGTGSEAKPRLKRANEFAPRVGLHQCVVCEQPLNKSLAVLLGPHGERALPSFLHQACSELLCDQWPDHTAMSLPDAARDTDSFFNALDVDGNGMLDKEELRVILAALWSGSPESFDAEFEKRWEQWDHDTSGDLSIVDFRRMHSGPGPMLRRSPTQHLGITLQEKLPVSLIDWVRAQCAEAQEDAMDGDGRSAAAVAKRLKIMDIFRKFDRNGNGSIELSEMEFLLCKLDPAWTPESVGELFRNLDLDHNGRINLNEFIAWTWDDAGEKASGASAADAKPSTAAASES